MTEEKRSGPQQQVTLVAPDGTKVIGAEGVVVKSALATGLEIGGLDSAGDVIPLSVTGVENALLVAITGLTETLQEVSGKLDEVSQGINQLVGRR